MPVKVNRLIVLSNKIYRFKSFTFFHSCSQEQCIERTNFANGWAFIIFLSKRILSPTLLSSTFLFLYKSYIAYTCTHTCWHVWTHSCSLTNCLQFLQAFQLIINFKFTRNFSSIFPRSTIQSYYNHGWCYHNKIFEMLFVVIVLLKHCK